MTWMPLALIASVTIVGLVIVLLSRSTARRCPTCGVGYQVVSPAGSGPNLTYDVLACPSCANTATMVRGGRGHPAHCPACGNRTLETPSVRLPGEPIRVEVREHCPMCRHERTLVVGDTLHLPHGHAPLGKVIPFPTDRTPRRKRDRVKEQ